MLICLPIHPSIYPSLPLMWGLTHDSNPEIKSHLLHQLSRPSTRPHTGQLKLQIQRAVKQTFRENLHPRSCSGKTDQATHVLMRMQCRCFRCRAITYTKSHSQHPPVPPQSTSVVRLNSKASAAEPLFTPE